jgi:hypothetical protein
MSNIHYEITNKKEGILSFSVCRSRQPFRIYRQIQIFEFLVSPRATFYELTIKTRDVFLRTLWPINESILQPLSSDSHIRHFNENTCIYLDNRAIHSLQIISSLLRMYIITIYQPSTIWLPIAISFLCVGLAIHFMYITVKIFILSYLGGHYDYKKLQIDQLAAVILV